MNGAARSRCFEVSQALRRSCVSAQLRGVLLALTPLFVACGSGSSRTPDSEASQGAVRWVGRADLTVPDAAKFSWSGSGFVAKVSGKNISVKLKSEGAGDEVFLQPVIDGAVVARVSVPLGEKTVALASGLSGGEHVVELYRDSEGKLGNSVFEGFVAGSLRAPPVASGRLIEIVGDSISAGYGNLGNEAHPNSGPDPSGGCHFSTSTESAYQTYGALAARSLGAEWSIIAASGWGVYRDNQNKTTNVMPNVYANTLGASQNPTWGFEPKPQVVVINLGTNDFANGDPGQSEFQGAYSAFLTTVREKNPDAWILCMIGPLLYGTGLTTATAAITASVSEAVAQGDAKIQILDVGQQDATLGTGCDWHPSLQEHERMAGKLASAVKAALGW